jgi:hypothetical protein
MVVPTYQIIRHYTPDVMTVLFKDICITISNIILISVLILSSHTTYKARVTIYMHYTVLHYI